MLPSADLRFPFQLRSLFQFVGQYPSSSVVLIDDEGKITRMSMPFLQVTEYTAMELEGIRYTDIIRFDGTLQQLVEQCASCIERGQTLPVITVRDKIGRWLTSEAMAVTFVSGEPIGCTILYLPGLLKQRGLTILQQFADSFMRNNNLGVLLFDPDGRLVEISDMACDILGHRRDCLLNKTIDELFVHVPKEYRLVHPSLMQGAVVHNQAVHWFNAQQRYDLLLDSNVLRDATGAIVGAYVILKDVSNLRSLEAQLHRSERLAMIGQIAAGTAHEIRNPLTSLRGFIQLLQSALDNRSLEREMGYLAIMKNEIDRIHSLVNEFLLLSKPKDVQYRPIAIEKAFRDILPMIESEANLYGITVNYVPAPHLPVVIADSELLKQVILNICKNAIESMESTGMLTICERVNHEKHFVHIDVHDTGPGIPNYLIDKIFDPFFTTKESGTGLGLAVCQRIVHDMGGHIRVRSKGFGTTFTVSLPFSS